MARAAIIAAVYFALSVAIQSIAFGSIQFRISEAMVLLPVFFAEAIPGLAIGCFLTNFFFSPFGIYDMLFGTLATLIAAILTRLLRKNIILASIPPMIMNALLVPLIWIADGSDSLYYINALSILASELIICGFIGVPLNLALKKAFLATGIIKKEMKYPFAPPYERIIKPQKDNAISDKENDCNRNGIAVSANSDGNLTAESPAKDQNASASPDVGKGCE